jgi:hypothetical protein
LLRVYLLLKVCRESLVFRRTPVRIQREVYGLKGIRCKRRAEFFFCGPITADCCVIPESGVKSRVLGLKRFEPADLAEHLIDQVA